MTVELTEPPKAHLYGGEVYDVICSEIQVNRAFIWVIKGLGIPRCPIFHHIVIPAALATSSLLLSEAGRIELRRRAVSAITRNFAPAS